MPYYDHKGITLYHGDCLEVMQALPAASFDAVICDPPYGTTACAWDSPIPFVPMWAALKRLIRPRAPVVLFGSQPFTSALVMSNIRWFKYQWVWDKVLPTDWHSARHRPMKRHEDVIVFSRGTCSTPGKAPMPYYPIMRQRDNPVSYMAGAYEQNTKIPTMAKRSPVQIVSTVRFPTSILTFSNAKQDGKHHPTQKPLALMEYLVKTYTNEGGCVLDFTCGSGTTLRACKNLGRSCVGIEQEERYCAVTAHRLSPAFENALTTDEADYTGTLFEGIL